jgi:cation/acetate symporter
VASQKEFRRRIWRFYGYYALGFASFVGLIAWLEARHGLSPAWIGYTFLFFTIALYAIIGVNTRPTSTSTTLRGAASLRFSTAWPPPPTG